MGLGAPGPGPPEGLSGESEVCPPLLGLWVCLFQPLWLEMVQLSQLLCGHGVLCGCQASGVNTSERGWLLWEVGMIASHQETGMFSKRESFQQDLRANKRSPWGLTNSTELEGQGERKASSCILWWLIRYREVEEVAHTGKPFKGKDCQSSPLKISKLWGFLVDFLFKHSSCFCREFLCQEVMRSCCLIDKTHTVKRFHLLWSSGYHCALQYIY